MSDKNDLFRCAHGYRMLFVNDVTLPLDLELVPRFKYPKMSGAQRGFAERNLKQIVKKMNHDYYFAFFFINNIAKTSNMPHIYEDEVSTGVVDRLHEIYKSFVEFDHIENYNYLKNSYRAMPNLIEKNGKTAIVNGLTSGELSILSVMRYHTEIEEVDLTELNKEKGLLSRRMDRILRQSLRLEDHYAFSKKLITIIEKNKL